MLIANIRSHITTNIDKLLGVAGSRLFLGMIGVREVQGMLLDLRNLPFFIGEVGILKRYETAALCLANSHLNYSPLPTPVCLLSTITKSDQT